MEKVKKFNIILNIISICVYVIITLFTSWILIDLYFMEKTEGTGIVMVLVYIFNSFECFFIIILNFIGIVVTFLNEDKASSKLKYKKYLLWRVIMIIVPILTIIIQKIINNLVY